MTVTKVSARVWGRERARASQLMAKVQTGYVAKGCSYFLLVSPSDLHDACLPLGCCGQQAVEIEFSHQATRTQLVLLSCQGCLCSLPKQTQSLV